MPLAGDRYRMKDGVTRLGEAFFNRVFSDVDMRLATLEERKLAWEAAVQELTTFGLQRIDAALLTTMSTINQRAQEADALVAGMQAQLDESLQLVPQALEAANEALDNVEQALGQLPEARGVPVPAVENALQLLRVNATGTAYEPVPMPAIADEVLLAAAPDTGITTLAAGEEAGQLLMVPGYGVYQWDAISTEPPDGEICIAPAAGDGRWWMVAPAWDFVWSHLSPVFDAARDQVDETISAAILPVQDQFTALQGRLLTAAASLDYGSIAAANAATLTLAVAGAAVGDAVFVTPPSTLASGLIPTALVSAPNTVSITLRNTTGSAVDPAAAVWRATVIKP